MNNLKTIQDALSYCKGQIALYREDMTPKEKEDLASDIFSFYFSDHFEDWYGQHPVVERIEAYASNLEWSNSSDIDEDWEKLKGFIEQLDREVNHGAPKYEPK